MAEELLVTRPHALGATEAKNRLDRYFALLTMTLPNLTASRWVWSDDTPYPGVFQAEVSFTAYGYSNGGRLVVTDSDVQAYGEIPFIAFPFRSRIISEISGGLDKGLSLAGSLTI